jgi:hypothetical protein
MPDRLAPRPLEQPHPDRLPLDAAGREAVLVAHTRALEDNSAGYVDPHSGLFVLTAAFLAAREHCCERGCRHCPYVL